MERSDRLLQAAGLRFRLKSFTIAYAEAVKNNDRHECHILAGKIRELYDDLKALLLRKAFRHDSQKTAEIRDQLNG